MMIDYLDLDFDISDFVNVNVDGEFAEPKSDDEESGK